MLYEGKAKQIYATDKADEVIVYYKDDATAFNGEKKGQIEDKGVMNNAITSVILIVVAGALAGFFPAIKATRP